MNSAPSLVSCRSLAAAVVLGFSFGFVPAASAAIAFDVDVNPDAGRAAISPLIYGTNQDIAGVTFPARRQGGNRMTGYNWENNASNAGTDWFNQSDNYLTWAAGVPAAQENTPAIVMTTFHDQSLAAGTAYSIVTLPIAGYVAADKSGEVTAGQVAPSSRWKAVVHTKPTALTYPPSTADGSVYTDELLQRLVTLYGSASTANGIKGYSLDNEPDLWAGTHPRIHPTAPGCVELINRSVDAAKAVKRIDAAAETIGFVSYGFNGYYSFQDAPDWGVEKTKGPYTWFVDYFLDRMKQASTTAGTRLLDVLDVHNYTEAQGGGERVNAPDTWGNLDCNKARIQAPRTYWDPTYIENSWIGTWFSGFLPLLPKLKTSITTFYPGTKLALTEYNFGGESHISGGLAQADTLGIFGQQGVYLANWWQLHDNPTYVGAAFKLYLNYDGAGGKFGDTKVNASASNRADGSAFASILGSATGVLHVVVLNKNYDNAANVTVRLAGATSYASARVFAFDAASATLTERAPVATITGNQFTYPLPALTAAHFVLLAGPTPGTYAAWKAANFTVPQQGDPAVSGPLADPDGAGVLNLQRYAFGLAAHGPAAVPAAGQFSDNAGQTYLAVTFNRIAVASDLQYVVESSGDLGGWSTVTTLAAGAPTEQLVRDTVPVSGVAKRFLRVRATLLP